MSMLLCGCRPWGRRYCCASLGRCAGRLSGRPDCHRRGLYVDHSRCRGAVGYAIYYIFRGSLTEKLLEHLVLVAVESGLHEEDVSKVIGFMVGSLLAPMRGIQGVTPEIFNKLVLAGQVAYAEAYPYVYSCSIGYAVISIVASLFVDDVSQYMDDRVAVVFR